METMSLRGASFSVSVGRLGRRRSLGWPGRQGRGPAGNMVLGPGFTGGVSSSVSPFPRIPQASMFYVTCLFTSSYQQTVLGNENADIDNKVCGEKLSGVLARERELSCYPVPLILYRPAFVFTCENFKWLIKRNFLFHGTHAAAFLCDIVNSQCKRMSLISLLTVEHLSPAWPIQN